MSAISKAIAIISWGRPTYLVSRNKYIKLWYQWLAYINNAWVVRVSKLLKSIDLGLTKEYNPTKVFMDLEDSEDFTDDSCMRQRPNIEVIDSGSTW